MAGRSRFPAGGSSGGAVGPPASPMEEANPFSFKEFVRSKNQNADPTAATGTKGGSGALLDVGLGTVASPKESGTFSLLLEDESFSPGSLALNLDLPVPFFPDPTATNSLLEEEEEEEEDWSSTYKPSAVEEAHLSRAPSLSLSSTFDLYYGDSSDSPERADFSPWQLGREGCLPQDSLQEADEGSPANGAALPDSVYPPRQPSYEELQRENSKFRSKIGYLQAVSKAQAERINELERTLLESQRKEEKEARDLEAMVQQVEENLQTMTKRAVKAESGVLRLKQENAVLQVQVENYQLENEALKRGHLASLAVVKQNTSVALQNLLAVLSKSRGSIKQLVSSAEELQLVAESLKSIDKISELPEDSP